MVPLAVCTSASPQDRFDAWVAFADKGDLSEGQREAAFQELERTFDPRALERRRIRRTRPGLFDEHDLPLRPEYLHQVSGTGAEVRVQSRWLNGVTVLATRRQLAAIEKLPFVQSVADVHAHIPKGSRGGRVPNDTDLRGAPGPGSDVVFGWSGPQIRQLQLHRLHDEGFTGSGVRIGVVDTGFLLRHPAFQGPDRPNGPIKVVDQWDFVDNDPVASPEAGDGLDQHEHGSLILGIVAANRPGELVGSAPDAEFILLKAEDGATEYFLEEKWFAAALEYAEARGADVVTSSVVLYEGYDGSDVDGRTSVMAQAWNLAVGNGIIGFQGAGNSGHDQDPSTHHMIPPAGSPGVITVGAVDSLGEMAYFSSDGMKIQDTVKPEFLAWGHNTLSISPYEPGAYTVSSGTSMATPLFAGAVACLLQTHPAWSMEELRDTLRRSGSYYREHGHPDPLYVQGYGIPDLALAAGLSSLPPRN